MIVNHVTCNTYDRMSAVRAFLKSQMSVSLLIGLTLELSGARQRVRLDEWLGDDLPTQYMTCRTPSCSATPGVVD